MGIDYKVNEKFKFGGSLNWKKVITEGKYLISDDEIEEENLINHNLSLDFKTPQPQSSLDLRNIGEYDLTDEEWEEIKFKLSRKLDCYSFSFSYEVIDKAFAIEFNIF